MWFDLVYLLPIAGILAKVEITEETTLEGDLQEELSRLFAKYISKEAFSFQHNAKLNASIRASYPERTNLWTILHGILERYHLIVEIVNDPERLTIMLLPGSAWESQK